MVDLLWYAQNLEKMSMVKKHEALQEDGNIQYPPEDEIQLRHGLITPAPFNVIHNKNLRVANLNPQELFVVRKGSNFLSWLEAMGVTHGIEEDKHIMALMEEVSDDLNVILNASASKKGWLVNNILSPVKKFSISGERAQRRGLFNRKNAEENEL